MTNKEILKTFFDMVRKHFFNVEMKVCGYDNWYQKFELELNLFKIFYHTSLEEVMTSQNKFKKDLMFLQDEDDLNFSCSDHFIDDKEFEEKKFASYCLFTNSEKNQISTFIQEHVREEKDHILLTFGVSISVKTKADATALIDYVYKELADN